MLTDTHAHLSDPKYGGADEIINNMTRDGLKSIISIGYDVESSTESKNIAERCDNVFFAAGIHPNNTYDLDTSYLSDLKKLLAHPKCVAMGEIGLDYHYDDTDKEKQFKTLTQQLELLSETDLPVVFHIRDSAGDMFDLIKQNMPLIKNSGVIHCYSGSLETALEYIKLGFYISFTGVITFKNAKKFPEIINALPRERVLIETDCPYLAPTPHRGEINYPAYVKFVAEKIAEIWGVTTEETADITTRNAETLFKKLKK